MRCNTAKGKGRDGPKSAGSYGWRDDPSVPDFDDVQPLVVFDGDCVLCSRSMRRVARWEPAGRIRMTPAQGALGQALYRHAGLPTDRFETYLFVDSGRIHQHSGAILAMARYFRWPWRWLRAFWIVPRPLRDGLYKLVARNRYTWFGRVEACGMRDPALMARLI